MHAIELLKTQHRTAAELFERIEDCEVAAEKQRLWDQLADTLTIHGLIEERHFYPSIHAEETEDLLEVALDEHSSMKQHIGGLLALHPMDTAFDTRLRELKEDIEHHVAEEEEVLFHKVMRLFDEETLMAIGDAMEEDAQELDGTDARFRAQGTAVSPAPIV